MTTKVTAETTWSTRLATGLDHEERVCAELERRGWTASQYGQGVLAEPVRRALKLTDSPRRSDPDLLAAHGSTACAIDAKSSMRGEAAPVYRISRRTLIDHVRMWAEGDLPLYYVFGNLGVATPAEVLRFCGLDSVTQIRGGYVTVDAGQPRPFDEVFGPPAMLQAAVELRPDLPVGIAVPQSPTNGAPGLDRLGQQGTDHRRPVHPIGGCEPVHLSHASPRQAYADGAAT